MFPNKAFTGHLKKWKTVEGVILQNWNIAAALSSLFFVIFSFTFIFLFFPFFEKFLKFFSLSFQVTFNTKKFEHFVKVPN